jgi:hypothetical protein
MDNFQKHNNYITIPSSQTFLLMFKSTKNKVMSNHSLEHSNLFVTWSNIINMKKNHTSQIHHFLDCFHYTRGRQTGVNYPKCGKNEILGGNEDPVETTNKDFPL